MLPLPPAFKRPALLASLCLAALPLVAALKGDSVCRERLPDIHFCVNATVENDVATYHLTNLLDSPEDVGWMAIGFGESMIRTPMVIMWRNSDGSMTLSQRRAVWYMEPIVERQPAAIASSIEPQLSAWHRPEKSTTFAFTIPVNRTQLKSHPVQNLVFAYSPSRPQRGEHAMIARHTGVGYLKVNLDNDLPDPAAVGGSPATTTLPAASPPQSTTSGGGGASAPLKTQGPSKHSKTVLAHGILLTLGFLVFLPTGVLTGRWARTFTPRWFKVHWWLNYPLALPMILLGWLLGPIAVNQHDGPHFSDPHKMWGTVLVSLYLVQLVVGQHIHKRRTPPGEPIKFHHPPLNIAHVFMGLTILVFAFIQVRTGLEKLTMSPDYGDVALRAIKAWKFWVVAVPFIYIVGLYFVPKQFAQEQAGTGAAANGATAYVALDETAPSPSTRLLFESGAAHDGGHDRNPDLDVEGNRGGR